MILGLFALVWIVVFAAVYRFLSKKHKLNVRLLFLYISFMAMLGPVGEIFIGTMYESVSGSPLWQYQILPTHHGYTSYYAPVIWGISGVLIYYSRELLHVARKKRKAIQASAIMIETILFEATLNLSFLVLSGGLIFYYSPGDLWHVTSVQTLPFYFAMGFVIMGTMKRLQRDPIFYTMMCLSLMFVIVYLTGAR